MRTVYYLLILILLNSCSTPEYKICEFETDDKELKLYHDILTELIEQRFYNGYLRQVSEELEKYPMTLEFSDTTAFKKDLILAQNRLFNDTAKFETICYNQKLSYGPWTYHLSKDTTKEIILRDFITDISPNWRAVADTIATAQDKYSSQDFDLCTSKVIPFGQRNDCGIGIVSFSKMVFNDSKTKALLYYEFDCSGNCGFGEIILVENLKGRWKVKKTNQLWIS